MTMQQPKGVMSPQKLFVQRDKGAKDRTLWLGENDIDKLRHWRQRSRRSLHLLV